MKAMWNDICLAQSDQTVVVEGNHYFPPDSLKREYFSKSDHTTFCGWKGTANYYNVQVKNQPLASSNANAAWYYATPMEKALNIKDHVAFGNDIKVVES